MRNFNFFPLSDAPHLCPRPRVFWLERIERECLTIVLERLQCGFRPLMAVGPTVKQIQNTRSQIAALQVSVAAVADGGCSVGRQIVHDLLFPVFLTFYHRFYNRL